MLAVTPAATEALVSLLRSPEVPEGAGVRLAHGLVPGGEPSIGLTIVEAAAGIAPFTELPPGERKRPCVIVRGTDRCTPRD
jgi:hypothetical protein